MARRRRFSAAMLLPIADIDALLIFLRFSFTPSFATPIFSFHYALRAR